METRIDESDLKMNEGSHTHDKDLAKTLLDLREETASVEDDDDSIPDDVMWQAQVGDDLEEFEKQKIYYTVTKKTAVAAWQSKLSLFEIFQIKGNFWKKTGFSEGGKNYLYPEEALYLLEKRQIALCRSIEDLNQQIYLTKEEAYDLILDSVLDLAAYLIYVKLKTLEYLPFRRNPSIRVFRDDREIQSTLARNPSKSLSDLILAYDVYHGAGENITKNSVRDSEPAAYLLMTNGRSMFSFSILIELIKQAGTVPIMIAIVFPTGNVILEEFTNAEVTLRLDNFPTSKPSGKKKRKKQEENNGNVKGLENSLA